MRDTRWIIEPPCRPSDGVPQSTSRSSDSVSDKRCHEPRGWLRNGNRPGDPSRAPRCGARNRRGLPCRCPAMKNGRCRLHGGLSTGPKTAEGLARIRKAVTKHGTHLRSELLPPPLLKELARIRQRVSSMNALSRREEAFVEARVAGRTSRRRPSKRALRRQQARDCQERSRSKRPSRHAEVSPWYRRRRRRTSH